MNHVHFYSMCSFSIALSHIVYKSHYILQIQVNFTLNSLFGEMYVNNKLEKTWTQ